MPLFILFLNQQPLSQQGSFKPLDGAERALSEMETWIYPHGFSSPARDHTGGKEEERPIVQMSPGNFQWKALLSQVQMRCLPLIWKKGKKFCSVIRRHLAKRGDHKKKAHQGTCLASKVPTIFHPPRLCVWRDLSNCSLFALVKESSVLLEEWLKCLFVPGPLWNGC